MCLTKTALNIVESVKSINIFIGNNLLSFDSSHGGLFFVAIHRMIVWRNENYMKSIDVGGAAPT